MIGEPVTLGPFLKGLNNSAGMGDQIRDDEVFDLVNLEVDLEGSLANRPAIRDQPVSGFTTTNIRVLGTWLPNNGRKFLVVTAAGSVHIIDPALGTSVANIGLSSVACIQYNNNLWVVAAPGSGTGGYFSVGASPSDVPAWNTVAAMPRGEAIVLYKSRLFVAAGLTANTNTSRLYYSDATTQATWPGFIDIEPGNGQKLVYMVSLNNDIVLFKEHSTFRFGYSSNPDLAEVSKVSDTIGVPSVSCAVVYDNNNVYVLHDNSVYELFNFSYTKISSSINMRQIADNTLYATEIYGLTLYRSRLFVRYFANLYVYSLNTKTWSRWVTSKKFSRIVVMPTANVGLDYAYASTASSDNPGKLYYFQDDRVTGVGTDEVFSCKVITKTYDFSIGFKYKVLGWWNLLIATSGNTTASVTVPNINPNLTWNQLAAYTWDYAKANIKWQNNTDAKFEKIIASTLGGYARKNLKFPGKLRFRQAFWTIETEAKANTVADSSVRIFTLAALVRDRQRVVRGTT